MSLHPAFATVPPGDDPPEPLTESAEESITRRMALRHPDWRGLGNRCGIPAEDMRRFLHGDAGLTGPMRKRIREALR